jgi:hypothetical protein
MFRREAGDGRREEGGGRGATEGTENTERRSY